MPVFNIKIEGTNKFIPIEATTKNEAIIKFIKLMNSKQRFMVKDPKPSPRSIELSKKMFRGRK